MELQGRGYDWDDGGGLPDEGDGEGRREMEEGNKEDEIDRLIRARDRIMRRCGG